MNNETFSAHEAPSGSRAVVVVSRDADVARSVHAARPLADFLALLIAAERRLGTHRLRRRAEPRDAVASYESGSARADRQLQRPRFERML